MKRPIFGSMALAVLAAAAACSPEAPSPAAGTPQGAGAAGWTRPPEVRAVSRSSGSLIFTGEAEPGGRVVLRSEAGPAYAAAADARGRFEIRMAVPVGHLLLGPETQVGQDAAASPDRLLIVDGGRGPVAVLRPGAPTRRLDAAPALGAVDSDGRMRMASGRASAPVTVQAGEAAVSVAPDASGRWSLMLRPSAAADQIRVGDAVFDWPGDAGGGSGQTVTRAGAGWRVDWAGAGGVRQSTWLPDRR